MPHQTTPLENSMFIARVSTKEIKDAYFQIDHTLIALIPKVDNPTTPN